MRKKPLFSHSTPFVLNINALHHKEAPTSTFKHWLNHLYRNDEPRPEEFPARRRDVFQPTPQPRAHARAVPRPREIMNHKFAQGVREPRSVVDDHAHDECECGPDVHHDCGCQDSDGESCRLDRDDSDRDLSQEPPDPQEEDGERRGASRRSPRPEHGSADQQDYMLDVAEVEGRKHLQQREADMFYAQAQPAPRQTASLPDLAARYAESQRKADPLMLFRAPPPWSALPTSPPTKTASPSTSAATKSMPHSVFASGPASSSESASALKRKRTELDAPADQARRRMHALSGIQSLVNMVQKRQDKDKEPAGRGAAQPRMVMPGRVNPFARTVQAGKQKTAALSLPVKRKASGPPTEPDAVSAGSSSSLPAGPSSAGPSGTRLPPAHASAAPEKARSSGASHKPQAAPSDRISGSSTSSTGSGTACPTEQSTSSDTPRPPKKLKPITSLTVPEWPNASHKPVSHHASKLKPPPPKPQVQTTLPASKVAAGAAKPSLDRAKQIQKEKRRVSAPVVSTPRLEMVVSESNQSAKPAATKGKADVKALGKGKEKRGAAFDWKSWGAG